MLERRRQLRGCRVLVVDAERGLGHYSLEKLEVGVVPQSFKDACRAAVVVTDVLSVPGAAGSQRLSVAAPLRSSDALVNTEDHDG